MSHSPQDTIELSEGDGMVNHAGWRRIDGYTRAFCVLAAAMVIVGGLVAALNSVEPFPHGSWLAAYLVLVGGAAQMLLGVGCLGLPAPRLSARLRSAQLALWNLGNAAVIAGVLGGSVGSVVAGSVALLAALGCFAITAGPSSSKERGRVILYRAAILGLAVSVVMGSMLAQGSPGN